MFAFLLKCVFFKIILYWSFFSVVREQRKHVYFHKLFSSLDVLKRFHFRWSSGVLKSGRTLCVVGDGAILSVFGERFVGRFERVFLFCLATVGLFGF